MYHLYSVWWWLSLCGLVSCKSDTLNKPDDDLKGEDDDTEDDDSHVHICFSMQ